MLVIYHFSVTVVIECNIKHKWQNYTANGFFIFDKINTEKNKFNHQFVTYKHIYTLPANLKLKLTK